MKTLSQVKKYLIEKERELSEELDRVHPCCDDQLYEAKLRGQYQEILNIKRKLRVK